MISKNARKIIDQIGVSNSERIDFLKKRLLTVDRYDHNCATTSLHLLGLTNADRAFGTPLLGLWSINSHIIFLRKGALEPVIVPAVNELVSTGYSFDKHTNCVFRISLDGVEYSPYGLRDLVGGSNQHNLIINPFFELDQDKLWEALSNLLKVQEIISHLTYRIRPGDGMIRYDEFHHSTLVFNQGKIYCIEKIYNDAEGLTITELDKNNLMNKVRIYSRSFNFITTAGSYVPPIKETP